MWYGHCYLVVVVVVVAIVVVVVVVGGGDDDDYDKKFEKIFFFQSRRVIDFGNHSFSGTISSRIIINFIFCNQGGSNHQQEKLRGYRGIIATRGRQQFTTYR